MEKEADNPKTLNKTQTAIIQKADELKIFGSFLKKPKNTEVKEEVKPKVYVTSRPKTAFNMRKRYDQTN